MMPPDDSDHAVLRGLAERWSRGQDPDFDPEALARLTLLEARHNLAVLELLGAPETSLPAQTLWEVPALLSTSALETALGHGTIATPAFASLRRLRPPAADSTPEASDILTRLYVEIGALRTLAALRQNGDLKGMRIRSRLTALRLELARVVVTLAREPRK